MRPWQITYTARSSAAAKSTRIEYFGTPHFCAFNNLISFLFNKHSLYIILNVNKKKNHSYSINDFHKVTMSFRYMEATICDAGGHIWHTHGGIWLNAIWNFDSEISRVLSNARDVQEYTWRAISGGYLYAEKRHWHSACGHWYPESRWEREPMQISKSKESDTLLLAVGSHQENVAAVHSAVKKSTKGLSLCLSVFACARAHVCTSLCACVCVHVCLSVCFSPGN